MFEELIPPEMREALCYCADVLHDLERVMGWACVAGHIPEPFEAFVHENIARMRRVSIEVLNLYRRREIALDVAIKRLEVECDIDALNPPGGELISRRSSAPPQGI